MDCKNYKIRNIKQDKGKISEPEWDQIIRHIVL